MTLLFFLGGRPYSGKQHVLTFVCQSTRSEAREYPSLTLFTLEPYQTQGSGKSHVRDWVAYYSGIVHSPFSFCAFHLFCFSSSRYFVPFVCHHCHHFSRAVPDQHILFFVRPIDSEPRLDESEAQMTRMVAGPCEEHAIPRPGKKLGPPAIGALFRSCFGEGSPTKIN